MSLAPLPIDTVLPELIAALKRGPSAVLLAPTGAGKTTRVPPSLLDAGLAGNKQILLLQPRRLAARAAAARMAQERGVPLGGLVGYQVRFDRRASRDTRILAVTEGIFVRLLEADPFLEPAGLVIFDEFHERNLDADVALAMVRRVQSEVRPDLKLLVMSATLAAMPVAQYLGGCPIVESQGRLHPVEIEYLPHDERVPVPELAARGTRQALSRTKGDVLVFLPGVGEIRRTGELLADTAHCENLALMELYGDLPLEQQQAVLAPAPRRKVVLATNVAETSVTIDGVTGVVDTGLARVLRLDANLGLNRLELSRISQASADQRAGRAGRTAPGICLRLWTLRQHQMLAAEETPEILRVDLAGPVLELLCWGETDLAAFPWFETPPAEAIDRAVALLRRLGAIDGQGVTSLGRRMMQLPTHPRLARLLVAGHDLGHPQPAALAAALLAERDPFRRRGRDNWSPAEHVSDSDVLDRVLALEEFQRTGRRDSPCGTLETGPARFVLRAAQQLAQIVDDVTGPVPTASISAEEALLRAVWAAFPDRLVRRRQAGDKRGVMIGGRGVRLDPASAVLEVELFVAVDLDETGRAESLVRQASRVERSWLPEDKLDTSVEVEFDPDRGRVVAFRRTRLEDLLLAVAPTSVPADYDAAALLAEKAAENLDPAHLLDEEARGYLARVRWLRQWMPELELPELGDDLMNRLLPRLCAGCRSLDDLRRAPALAAIKSLLSPEQLVAVERHAPERLLVPSGSRIALAYEPGKSPILAVRIQELFGLAETPRVAAGRIPVLLHLLGPNYRPQQVTSDLASFWRNTYPEVRKELRRRYPKHAWPDDPLSAAPESRPRRKPS